MFWMSLCFSLTWDSVSLNGRRQGFMVTWVSVIAAPFPQKKNSPFAAQLKIAFRRFLLGLKRAFESLISHQYRSFILTVGCITVSIVYCVYNDHFKVFDSHARDIYGKSHRQGTCVLLDIPSKENLIQYFQSLYGIHQMYELKGLQITKYDNVFCNAVSR